MYILFFFSVEGKRLASKRGCKFLEVSALLDHKVDEVLVTIVREARARMRRRCLQQAASINDDLSSPSADLANKGCLQRAAFAIFRKLFK